MCRQVGTWRMVAGKMDFVRSSWSHWRPPSSAADSSRAGTIGWADASCLPASLPSMSSTCPPILEPNAALDCPCRRPDHRHAQQTYCAFDVPCSWERYCQSRTKKWRNLYTVMILFFSFEPWINTCFPIYLNFVVIFYIFLTDYWIIVSNSQIIFWRLKNSCKIYLTIEWCWDFS